VPSITGVPEPEDGLAGDLDLDPPAFLRRQQG